MQLKASLNELKLKTDYVDHLAKTFNNNQKQHAEQLKKQVEDITKLRYSQRAELHTERTVQQDMSYLQMMKGEFVDGIQSMNRIPMVNVNR